MKRLQRNLSIGANRASHELAVRREAKETSKNDQLLWTCSLLTGHWPETGFEEIEARGAL
jgi:hypothetical protein